MTHTILSRSPMLTSWAMSSMFHGLKNRVCNLTDFIVSSLYHLYSHIWYHCLRVPLDTLSESNSFQCTDKSPNNVFAFVPISNVHCHFVSLLNFNLVFCCICVSGLLLSCLVLSYTSPWESYKSMPLNTPLALQNSLPTHVYTLNSNILMLVAVSNVQWMILSWS